MVPAWFRNHGTDVPLAPLCDRVAPFGLFLATPDFERTERTFEC